MHPAPCDAFIPLFESSITRASFVLTFKLLQVFINISGLGFPYTTSSPLIIISKIFSLILANSKFLLICFFFEEDAIAIK